LAVEADGATKCIGRLIHARGASGASGRLGGVKESNQTIFASSTGMTTHFLKFTSATRITHTIDQFGPSRTSGTFVGIIGGTRGARCSGTTGGWTIALIQITVVLASGGLVITIRTILATGFGNGSDDD
jgi:hypothetical protein